MVMVGMAMCGDGEKKIVPSLHVRIPDRSIYLFWGSHAEAVRELRSRRRRRGRRRRRRRKKKKKKKRKKKEEKEEE